MWKERLVAEVSGSSGYDACCKDRCHSFTQGSNQESILLDHYTSIVLNRSKMNHMPLKHVNDNFNWYSKHAFFSHTILVK